MNDRKKHIDKFSIKEVVVLLVITALVSLATGFVVANRVLSDNKYKANESTNDKLETFIKNYNYIIDNYYGDYDEQKLLDAALAGVLDALGDPHTVYIDESSVDNFNIQLKGNYTGLGIEIYNSGNDIIISRVFTNSPAAIAGLQVDDCILKINDQEVTGMKTKDFADIIKSSQNSFKLLIKRNDEFKEIIVEKENVVIDSVTSKIYNRNERNIGYLDITIFADNTYSQFKEKLEELEKFEIDSLVIDVRNNAGGHLTSVESIISLFLDSSHIIYKMEDSNGIKEYYSTGKETKTYPIIVLTNSSSASASEILTAALKEEYGAKSVGKKTYGKGSAQELRTLPDGTQYKITTHKWLTPKGNSIDGVGIDVDRDIELSEQYLKNPIEDNDNQLQETLKMLCE